MGRSGNKSIFLQKQFFHICIWGWLLSLSLPLKAGSREILPESTGSKDVAYHLKVSLGMKNFTIPYRNLNAGDCFCLISREPERWSWGGKKKFKGEITGDRKGIFENIPIPEGIIPGDYRFDVMVGITYGDQICYSDPCSLVVSVFLKGDVEKLVICSGEEVVYTPEKYIDCTDLEKCQWKRSDVAGIQEKGTSGVGSINEVLTNITSRPIDVVYFYQIASDENEKSKNFKIIVTVNPRLDVEIVDYIPELCSGEETQIRFAPESTDFNWVAETSDVEGAMSGEGNEIRQRLYAEEKEGTVIYRILPLAEGCMEERRLQVRVKPLPEISLQKKNWNERLKIGEALEIEATPEEYTQYEYTFNGQRNEQVTPVFRTYRWKEGELNTLKVEVVGENACKNADSLTFTGPELDLPNVTTPNGDGRNDILFKGYQLEVFNRNGSRVYKGVDGWDGRYHGELVPTDTYLYVILYPTEEGKLVEYKYHVYVVTDR